MQEVGDVCNIAASQVAVGCDGKTSSRTQAGWAPKKLQVLPEALTIFTIPWTPANEKRRNLKRGQTLIIEDRSTNDIEWKNRYLVRARVFCVYVSVCVLKERGLYIHHVKFCLGVWVFYLSVTICLHHSKKCKFKFCISG